MIILDRTWRLVRSGHCIRIRHHVVAFVQIAGIAALMYAYADTAVAESFGRLFFSTEERRTLDDMRERGVEPEGPNTQDQSPESVAPVVNDISFDGKVERSGGSSTIWVNGRPVFTGNRTVEGIRVQSSRGTNGETQFVLPPSDTGTTKFSLKVGQKVAVQNGRMFDAYESRPGEDAESVLDEDAPAEPAAQPGTDRAPADTGSSNADKPTPGN